jgi:hypothetical protein
VSLYWLCYQRDGQVEVVIQPGSTLMFARLGAGIAKLDEGDLIEGHCLNAAMSARIPKNMIGKRLSQQQAKNCSIASSATRGAETARS